MADLATCDKDAEIDELAEALFNVLQRRLKFCDAGEVHGFSFLVHLSKQKLLNLGLARPEVSFLRAQ